MKTLNLHAEGPEQERLKAYLEENASDALAEKINNGTPYEKDGKQLINKKDLPDFMVYATKEAEKLAKEKKKTGAITLCVDGEIIIGWLMHYFEEDDIEGVLYTLDGTPYKPAPKPVSKPTVTAKPTVPVPPTPPKPKSPQTSMFDMFDLSEDKTTEEPEQEEPATEDDDEDAIEEQQDTEEPIEEEDVVKGEAIEESVEPTPVEEVTPTIETLKTKPVSGLYAQYLDYQDSYPGNVIAMRIGDFYEVFGDDAVDIAKRLDLTLTSRDVGLENRIPLVGFPYHAAENYFDKIAAFKTVVVVESDGEVRGYPTPQQEESEPPQAPMAKFDDEGFFQLLRILDKVEVK